MERPDVTTADWPLLNLEPCSTWRPGQRPRPRKSVAHTISGAMAMLRSAVQRTDYEGIDEVTLAKLVTMRRELDAVIAEAERRAVAELRSHGSSWTDIGRVLGITRQAAQQRFGGAA